MRSPDDEGQEINRTSANKAASAVMTWMGAVGFNLFNPTSHIKVMTGISLALATAISHTRKETSRKSHMHQRNYTYLTPKEQNQLQPSTSGFWRDTGLDLRLCVVAPRPCSALCPFSTPATCEFPYIVGARVRSSPTHT